jgi:holo-[acyl-carrier protein] synthase
MIIGIGTDLTDTRRIESSVTRFGARFVTRIYTEGERLYAEKSAKRFNVLAKRFAAKEALMKALGTGLRGFRFQDIEVASDDLGKPLLILHNGALKRLIDILPTGHKAYIHLSLTDEGPYAMAFVIIEALPEP